MAAKDIAFHQPAREAVLRGVQLLAEAVVKFMQRLNVPNGLSAVGYTRDDIPALVDIGNRTFPNDPTTVEEEEYSEKMYPPDNPRLRFAVENAAGQFIGVGVCLHPYWMKAPGVYFMWIMLNPDWRRRGIGRALVNSVIDWTRETGAESVVVAAYRDLPWDAPFYARLGFQEPGAYSRLRRRWYGPAPDTCRTDGEPLFPGLDARNARERAH